jgi:hypothetical protein
MRSAAPRLAIGLAVVVAAATATSVARGLSWTYPEVTRSAASDAATYRLWERGSEDAVMQVIAPSGEVLEERRCSQGVLTHLIASGSVVERSDISSAECLAAVSDPVTGLWRRIAELGLSGTEVGTSADGHSLMEYEMPPAYDAYDRVVVDATTRRPVEAHLRSGGTVTWSYRVTEWAEPPPDAAEQPTEAYLPLDLQEAAALFGSGSIPTEIESYVLVSAQTAQFSSRTGPTHGLIWRDEQSRELQAVLDVGVASEGLPTGLDPSDPAGPVLRTIQGNDVL